MEGLARDVLKRARASQPLAPRRAGGATGAFGFVTLDAVAAAALALL